ncbi:methyltransferase domain-containing protein [Jiangella asiatica]|uniref:methyltransferase domain-containing protein n=1 Tax=Jiangella asiatica TaxID=2530372 RepID=UPI00193E0A56|nr:methyltransferase domain-containing protein [Jiangella asiatica]
MTIILRRRDGAAQPLALDHWVAPATPAERALLAALPGPVLDLGCGPGRLVVALGELGIPALGVDASDHAVAHARARGALALRYSIFDRLPGEGRWRGVLLLDGNVGIGGSPEVLLSRVGGLLAPDGHALVETAPPGVGTVRAEARLERDGEVSGWFPWAWVAADDLAALAGTAGLRLAGWHEADGRWIARLRREAA